MASVRPDDEEMKIHSNRELWRLVVQDRYRFVINGHSHQRMVRSFANSRQPDHPLTVINAGTLRREHHSGYVVIDFMGLSSRFFCLDEDEVPRLDQDVPLA